MKIKEYVEFIKEARRRGFRDDVIKNALLQKGWPLNEINIAFNYADTMKGFDKINNLNNQETHKGKYTKEVNGSSITIFLDDDLRTALEKRAKKNMINLPGQIEDILRRSTINQKGKKSIYNEKLDDKLVGLFSRKNTGPKAKSKKKKLTEEERRKHVKAQREYKKRLKKKARKEERLKRKAERRKR
jgi:hypothetical protein